MKFHPSMVHGHGCTVTCEHLSATNLLYVLCKGDVGSADALSGFRFPPWPLGFGTITCGKWLRENMVTIFAPQFACTLSAVIREIELFLPMTESTNQTPRFYS